jgi:hypothetical protein
MTAERSILTDTFRVGKYTVTMTIQKPRIGCVTHAVCEWEPDQPIRLTKRELKQYRKGRDALAAKVLESLGGGNGLIVET